MPSSDWSSDVCSSDRSEEHTSELQSLAYLVCRLLLEKKISHKSYDHDLQALFGSVKFCPLLFSLNKYFSPCSRCRQTNYMDKITAMMHIFSNKITGNWN